MTDPIAKAFEAIKTFHGTAQDNSRDWCDRAEIVFIAFNVNDADRLARIPIKLEDAAFEWYRDNPGPYATWILFRAAFERAFPPPTRTQNRHLLAEQINQRKQDVDESVHDYYYALDKLCREYDPQMSAIDKTIRLVGGLRSELKEKNLPLNVQTPEEFMNHAKNFESSQKVMAHHYSRNESAEFGEPTYMFESNQHPTIAASRPYDQRNQSTNSSFTRHSKSFKKNDHQCQQRRNHQSTTRNLPLFSRRREQSSQYYQQNENGRKLEFNQRRCFQCGEQGHIQRQCPHYLNDYKGQ